MSSETADGTFAGGIGGTRRVLITGSVMLATIMQAVDMTIANVALPNMEGLTANLSERGMFVSTGKPLDPGAAIRLRVILDAFTVPLRGVVVWNRRELEPGRPTGMGVRILLPSTLYTEYVAQLP